MQEREASCQRKLGHQTWGRQGRLRLLEVAQVPSLLSDGEAACGGAWLCSFLGRGQREDLRTEVVTATVSGAWIPFSSPGGTKTSGCFNLASSIGAEQ